MINSSTMKLLAASLLAGVAIATSPAQHVLHPPKQAPNPLNKLRESWTQLTGEARAVWDEVSELYPEAMAKAGSVPPPKRHSRRPDSFWDHIVKGEDVQSLSVENRQGERERDIDGHLENYNLRIRKVDPSALGVDPGVRQYSGYLDDEETDKHLFYCGSEFKAATIWIG